MNATQLLADYQKLMAKHNELAPLEKDTVQLEICPQRMATESEAWDYIQQFAPSQGWLGWQSKDQSFRTGLPERNAEYGVLLSGEMVNARHESIQLRYDSAQGWHISHYFIRPGEDYFCDIVRHIAAKEHLGYLCYKRFWKVDTSLGSAPWASCFIGYTEK